MHFFHIVKLCVLSISETPYFSAQNLCFYVLKQICSICCKSFYKEQKDYFFPEIVTVFDFNPFAEADKITGLSLFSF